MKIVVGISGASGAPYARRLLQLLAAHSDKPQVDVVLSQTAEQVWALECGGSPIDLGHPVYNGRNYDAPFASGSSAYDAMVIVPASMSTVARVAQGLSDDLLTRAADVMLKERRKLIVVPRETLYSSIHLQNMLELSRAGAVILPASPSFYGQAATVEQLLDTVLARIFDHLGLHNSLATRWGSASAQSMDHGGSA